MSNLNDVDAIRAIDPENMYNCIFDLPEQMSKALKLAGGWNVPPEDFPDVKNVVVVGMGGSAIAGDLIRSFLGSELLVPFQICRHYQLPEYVDDETLVIASSYSGNTEETLAAVDDALGRKAMMMALTTGGLLEEVCKLNEVPMLKLPGGLQPRAAIGFSFVPIMMFLERIGLIKEAGTRIKAAIQFLERSREKMIEDNPAGANPAKQLASIIHGSIPIIYTGPTIMDVVGLRWKAQICENSKCLAFCNQTPEFNHNEICGWSPVIDLYKDNFIVINLRSTEDHPKVAQRMDVVKELLEEQDVQVMDLYASGETDLERVFNLIQMGDFVSYYLAILNEVNPTPVPAIEDLKKRLKSESHIIATVDDQPEE
ncbi:MAG: bifunctional phosphoglucose/phosphomannose isomerase [candidate division Zixibacteria bacterium]|nr:bifunctional phosphoglucose/phosphomannose isomerase [candidate division Zixibacteria bacterium]